MTNEKGQITVNDLHWFDYRWVMTGVPTGYVKSADTAFTISYNVLSKTDSVILYMKHVSITIDSQVSDVIYGENAPAFVYHISGTDVAGVEHAYNILVQTDMDSKKGSNMLTNVFAGTYTVTYTPVSRYTTEIADTVIDILDTVSAEVTFLYNIEEYGWHYSVNSLMK